MSIIEWIVVTTAIIAVVVPLLIKVICYFLDYNE